MADVACNGSPCGTYNGLKHNVCVSIAGGHCVFHFVGAYFEVTAVYAEHLMIPGDRRYCRYLTHHFQTMHAPKAPIASNRSASWTQCSSTHSSCHDPHFPSCLSFFSVVQETFVTMSAISLARFPFPVRRPTEGCFASNSSNMGRKNAYGSEESDSGTYFLSRTSWRSAESSITRRSGEREEIDGSEDSFSAVLRTRWTECGVKGR